jgi:hypothetical protein
MSLLDTASLIVTPNGYKASKLYSIVPSDGTGDMTFSRTGNTATRVNSSGVIETVNANIPRLDYTDSTCPKLLLEPQRTNLLLNSATLSTQSVTTTAVAYTLSFYGTGTVVLSGAFVRTLTGTGASNRVSTTFTSTAAVLILTVTGSVTNAQLEAGSFATSYIPTTSASVTRNADSCTKTSASALIGQTEGVVFFDVNLDSRLSYTNLKVRNTAATNYIAFAITNTIIRCEILNNNVFQAQITHSNTSTGRFKMAVAYKENDISYYLNGTLIGTDTIATIPTCDIVDFYFNATNRIQVNSFGLWKTRLTNSELAQLTTL